MGASGGGLERDGRGHAEAAGQDAGGYPGATRRFQADAERIATPPSRCRCTGQLVCQESAPNMAPSRLRLAALSHTQLLELAAAGCEASSEVASQGEAILLVVEGVQRAIEGVLLSSDLLPYVLAPLQLEDGAAAAVCSLWVDGWKATGEGRRRLVRVAFDFPQHRFDSGLTQFAVIPGDDERLIMKSGERPGRKTRIVDHNLNTVSRFSFDEALIGRIAADEQSMYVHVGRNGNNRRRVSRFTHDGTEVASYEYPVGFHGYAPVLAPGGLLFCVYTQENRRAAQSDQDGFSISPPDEILALDAQSMQLRYRFRLPFNDILGLTVVGEELFVYSRDFARLRMDSLEVFSLAGEHLRSITGEWKQPGALCHVKDRLYLIEEEDEDDYSNSFASRLRGQRIFVLSEQGDTLQVDPMTVKGHYFSGTLIYFDGMLLAEHRSYLRSHLSGPSAEAFYNKLPSVWGALRGA